MAERLQHPYSWRAWLIAVLAGLLCGITALSLPIDFIVRGVEFKLHSRPVSGDIVVVGVDDATLAQSGADGFTRADAARTINAIRKAGAKRLFVDFVYDQPAPASMTETLEKAIAGWGDRITMAVMFSSDNAADNSEVRASKLTGIERAGRASIGINYQLWGVWQIPYADSIADEILPTFSSRLADLEPTKAQKFWPDYAFDYSTIPTYGASDLTSGKIPSSALAGKDVVFAPLSPSLLDMHFMPGHNPLKVPGVFFHVIGGETLRAGTPLDFGWIPAWALITVALLVGRQWPRKAVSSILIMGSPIAAILTVLAVPTYIAVIAIGPALVTSVIVGIAAARRRRQRRVQSRHHASGLPNFEALRDSRLPADAVIVAAKLVGFDALSIYLTPDQADQLSREVIRRLRVAAGDMPLYHDENGFFAWVTQAKQSVTIDSQLAGLSALFINPIAIGSEQIDVELAFGVEPNSQGTASQQLAAAMVAAEDSQRKRKTWSAYEAPQVQEARWQHSFQSQLSDALLNGEIWVAYQPQLDLKTNRIVGAEALARWSHPKLGNISPTEFISQAEKHQRIERLTLYVLNEAIGRAAEMLNHIPGFTMSVNMSALLLHRHDLAGQIRALLTAHGVAAQHLTIEITETAEIEDSDAVRYTLAMLREMGCRLSIDDYGTGQSNLDYLTRFEADEIKIDKRFVDNILDSKRNREVVTSTIEMAHRLGATTVAEGVEDERTLTILSDLGCDVIQGYLIGKPMRFDNFMIAVTSAQPSSGRATG
ncbi:EAL domain-containing protein [Sphingorhabdus soli]|uniref:EAL domain-containing protein n=1 Tax=Flavisphingopyxis soli TaxID=2601267 RepID=A0A5C6UKG6_9SPHN|nr:EAL domain-containing protein [Sphingorhabdus soli]TXC73573.1 EAL domain-containing protein [Sphingorhabdus soli]